MKGIDVRERNMEQMKMKKWCSSVKRERNGSERRLKFSEAGDDFSLFFGSRSTERQTHIEVEGKSDRRSRQ